MPLQCLPLLRRQVHPRRLSHQHRPCFVADLLGSPWAHRRIDPEIKSLVQKPINHSALLIRVCIDSNQWKNLLTKIEGSVAKERFF